MTESLMQPGKNSAARLLVVDDEALIRTSLARALSLQGYAVEEAGCGREALESLKQTVYDLMVLDMHMPDIDGVAVMRHARHLQPELSIIILTGHPTLENAIAGVKLGAVDYLLKPASMREILAAVTEALQKRPQQLST